MPDLPLVPVVDPAVNAQPVVLPPQTPTEVWVKRGMVVVVAAAGIAEHMLPAESKWQPVLAAIFAIGAALGITSSGNRPRK